MVKDGFKMDIGSQHSGHFTILKKVYGQRSIIDAIELNDNDPMVCDSLDK